MLWLDDLQVVFKRVIFKPLGMSRVFNIHQGQGQKVVARWSQGGIKYTSNKWKQVVGNKWSQCRSELLHSFHVPLNRALPDFLASSDLCKHLVFLSGRRHDADLPH